MRKNSFVAGVFLALAAVSAAAFSDPSKLPQPEFRQIIVGGGALVTGTVEKNSDLALLSTLFIKKVTRLGHTAIGDGPAVDYIASASACSLSAGAGDGGSQVPSSDGKCWIANLDGIRATPKVWGCKGDGVTNDQACLLKAATAMAGKTLYIDSDLYGLSSTWAPPSSLHIQGAGRGIQSGFRALATNLNLINLPTLSRLSDVYIDMGTAGLNTSGAVITLDASTQSSVVDNVYIQSPCIGIDLAGNSHTVHTTVINGQKGTGCGGIRIGQTTTGTGTIGPRIFNNVVASNQDTPAEYGMLFKDVGGSIVYGNDLLFSVHGTKILPGANQTVQWGSWSGYIGDSTTLATITIDTAAASAEVRGLEFNGAWGSSALADACVKIRNTGGGILTGIKFIGGRYYNCGGNGFDINAGSHYTFSSVSNCGNGTGGSGSGYLFDSGVSYINLIGGITSGSCDGFGQTLIFGVLFGGSNNHVVIDGLDLSGTGVTNKIGGSPISESIITNVNGVETDIPTIASAATITLPTNPTIALTGATTISTINGGWNARKVTFLPGSGVTFSGGNICQALTATSGVPVTALFVGCWYLK